MKRALHNRWWLPLVLAIAHAGSVAAQAPREVTHDEALAWVQAVGTAWERQGGIAELVDLDALLARAVDGIDISDERLAEVFPPDQRRLLMAGLEVDTAQTPAYRFLRVREVDGRQHVIFRVVNRTGQDDYHEWMLHRDARGEVRACDLQMYLSGIRLSDGLREMLLELLDTADDPAIQSLSEQEQERLPYLRHFYALHAAMGDREYRIVLSLLDDLPESVRAECTPMIHEFQAHYYSGDEAAYLQAVAAFREAHADAYCFELVQLGVCLQREEWERVLALVDRLDERLGGDPYLEAHRALVYYLSDRPAASREAVERGLAQDDSIEQLYRIGLMLALQAEDWALVRLLLERAEAAGIIYDNEVIVQTPEFDGFVASEEYTAWRSRGRGEEDRRGD